MTSRKPSRRDLIVGLAKLQVLIGHASAKHGNDRDRNGYEKGQKTLEQAHELCIALTASDAPTDPSEYANLRLP